MILYIRQKVFSWGDHFTVKDEFGEDKYMVQGEVFSWGKKLHICDMTGREVLFIKQDLFSFLPRYDIYRGQRHIAQIKKEFTFLFPKYTVDATNWEITGDFTAHDYRITDNSRIVVTISKQGMTWGDSYQLNILDPADELLALATVLTIDSITDSQSGASVSVSSN